MPDLGAPIAYLALEEGTPVYSSDGRELGTVEHVLAATDADVFDGLVISGPRFVDAPEVAEIHERGVLLGIDAAAAESLPEPSENPGALRVDPADAEESDLSEKLRRAWDYISGRY
jgi:sporulation protein YlmC with PRC-barrel domain